MFNLQIESVRRSLASITRRYVHFIYVSGGSRGGGRGRTRYFTWSISLIIEDLVVSYTSKAEIPISSYI